jgi:hypothetical protein
MQNSGNRDKSETTFSVNLQQNVCMLWHVLNKRATERLTRMYCLMCDIGLCLMECFGNYHLKISYWQWSCQVNLVHLMKSWHWLQCVSFLSVWVSKFAAIASLNKWLSSLFVAKCLRKACVFRFHIVTLCLLVCNKAMYWQPPVSWQQTPHCQSLATCLWWQNQQPTGI